MNLCNILLGRNKLTYLTSLKGRNVYKGVDTKRWGSGKLAHNLSIVAAKNIELWILSWQYENTLNYLFRHLILREQNPKGMNVPQCLLKSFQFQDTIKLKCKWMTLKWDLGDNNTENTMGFVMEDRFLLVDIEIFH